MSYALENITEAERLEFQAKIENYSIQKELSYLDLSNTSNVLDLGCGTGLLSREIKMLSPPVKY